MYSQKGSKDENVRYTTEYLGMSSEVYQSRKLYKIYLKFLGGFERPGYTVKFHEHAFLFLEIQKKRLCM